MPKFHLRKPIFKATKFLQKGKGMEATEGPAEELGVAPEVNKGLVE